jgi:hypothetical protein
MSNEQVINMPLYCQLFTIDDFVRNARIVEIDFEAKWNYEVSNECAIK